MSVAAGSPGRSFFVGDLRHGAVEADFERVRDFLLSVYRDAIARVLYLIAPHLEEPGRSQFLAIAAQYLDR